MLETLIAILTTGASGGVIGAITGLFKQHQEYKERIQLAKLDLARDKEDRLRAREEHQQALEMLNRKAELNIKEREIITQSEIAITEAQTEAEIGVANQNALSSAQDIFKNLKTTSGIDNYRASVRPTLAYWAAVLFTLIICWAFYKFGDSISEEEGRQILIGLFGTLNFIVTSVITFYYISRRNNAPKLI